MTEQILFIKIEPRNEFRYGVKFEAIENNEEDESNKIFVEPIVLNDEEFEYNLLEETFANPSNGFVCNKCDFVAKTEAGLKTHNNKKHKNNKN